MADQPSRTEELEERFPGKYLSLTSYERDGTGVATPVWFVIDDGRLLIMTDPESFKAKRIRHNPNVTVAACSAAGRLRGDPVPARAELLPDSQRAHLDQLMARKYSWLARVTLFRIDQVLQRLKGKRAGAPTAILAITPLQSDVPGPQPRPDSSLRSGQIIVHQRDRPARPGRDQASQPRIEQRVRAASAAWSRKLAEPGASCRQRVGAAAR